MSRVDCGSGAVPCYCDCGHLSSWHCVYERWRAKCLVDGCVCMFLDVCGCVAGFSESTETDAGILASIGIKS